MDSLGYLFAANAFVWAGIFFYVATLKNRQQALRRYTLNVDEPRRPMREHTSFAAAGARNNEQRFGGRSNGLALRIIQGFKYWGDVHRGFTVQKIGRGKSNKELGGQ